MAWAGEPGRLMETKLSCDHWILDCGAEFLAEIRLLLEKPIGLTL